MLTPGQAHDLTCAESLLEGANPDALLGDKAYDGDSLIDTLARRGITPVIPPKANRKVPRACDFALYCERNLIERFFNKLKHFRAIATRYDKPRNLGRNATGGHLAAPVARDFMKLALADKPAVPFRVPAGIKLIRVDAKSGMRAGPGDSGRTILEAFKPGTAPPDNYSVIGVADADGRPLTVSPDADRTILRSGTGGLY